jgi:hypothetical protein
MPAETRETDGWSETVETGYVLRFRDTGVLARIHADHHECHPTSYSLTADDEDPIYDTVGHSSISMSCGG